MPKTHQIYNQIAILAGPAPSTGYHCITNYGYLNNEIPAAENYNLIFPIERAISTSFSIQPQRTQITELGTEGLLARPILNNTEVTLNFSYYLMGLINETRLGLLANIPSGSSQTGRFLYGTGRVCPISGLNTRDFDNSNDTPLNWPLKYRDARNIFAISRKDYLDANDVTGFNPLVKNNSNFYTTAFGDCYLDSYETSCSIGQLPQANVKFTCNNVMVYDGISGKIPSIMTRTHESNSGVNFYIPNNFEGTGNPTVILPSDISLNINQSGGAVSNLFNNFDDIKIQGYTINFQLQREPLYNLGYKYPMDRAINLPAIANISIDTIPGDIKSSSLVNLLKQDDTYNFNIKLNYQNNTRNFSGTAFQYDFIGASFDGMDESISISNKKTNTYSFSVEMKPNNQTNGFFMSGYLGIPTRTGQISYLSGAMGSGFILDAGGNKIQISTAEYIPIY